MSPALAWHGLEVAFVQLACTHPVDFVGLASFDEYPFAIAWNDSLTDILTHTFSSPQQPLVRIRMVGFSDTLNRP